MSQSVAGSRATRIARTAVGFLWWLALIGGVGIAGWFLLSPFLMRGQGAVSDVRVPVSIGSGTAVRIMPLTSQDTLLASDPFLVRGQADLQFETRSWGLQFLANGVTLLGILAVLVGLHLVRSILTDVRAAQVFTRANARRLSRLGWLLVAVGVGAPILEYWRSSIILGWTRLEGVRLAPALLSGWDPILWGILVLVLAAVWRYGVELQQDRDLTV